MRIQISKITIAIGIFIIISASFTKQVMDFIKAKIGAGAFTALIGLILIISGLFFLIFIVRDNSKFIKTSILVAALILGLVLSWQIKIPEEKIHILEYAVLGWFGCKDLIKLNLKTKGAVLACLFCVSVGILDEIFQAVLPYRFFQIKDIVFNGLGGFWGISLFLLS